jgi:hypothetical protein
MQKIYKCIIIIVSLIINRLKPRLEGGNSLCQKVNQKDIKRVIKKG